MLLRNRQMRHSLALGCVKSVIMQQTYLLCLDRIETLASQPANANNLYCGLTKQHGRKMLNEIVGCD